MELAQLAVFVRPPAVGEGKMDWAPIVDAADPENIARAIRPETRAVYIESLANPKNAVLDYQAIASEIKSKRAFIS